MANSTPPLTNFTGGELSPRLNGRVDLRKYFDGCSELENMLVFPHGGASRRSGFRFIGETKNSAKASRLVPFIFSEDVAYVIEFGDGYARFYRNGAQVEIDADNIDAWSSGATYSRGDYVTNGGSIYLCTAASGTGSNAIGQAIGAAIGDMTGGGGLAAAFDGNDNQAAANCASKKGEIGYVGKDYSAAAKDVIAAQVVGSNDKGMVKGGFLDKATVELITNSVNDPTTGTVQETVTVSDSAGKTVYVDISSAVNTDYVWVSIGTGNTAATNYAAEVTFYEEGTAIEPGVTSGWEDYWEEVAEGAFELVTPYTDDLIDGMSFSQSADVLYIAHPALLPRKISRTAVDFFEIERVSFTSRPSKWSSGDAPQAVTFHQQRLIWAGTPSYPSTIWFSKTGDFENLTTGSAADDALEISLDSDTVEEIKWMKSSRQLLIGTIGGTWAVGGSSVDAAIAPDNIQATKQSAIGTADSNAWLVSNPVLYIERGRKKVREMAYVYEDDGYPAQDMSLLAEHLGSDSPFASGAYAPQPDTVLWLVRDDGTLCSLTYQRSQEVVAWARHTTQGTVESVAAIPSSSEYELWAIINRTVDGNTVRYVERLEPQFSGTTTDDETCVYLDSHLTYSGSAVSTIAGLTHLIGEEVSILADGATHPNRTVDSNGEITLERPASTVVAGLPYTSTLTTMEIEGGSPAGVSQTKNRRTYKLGLRFYKTLGAKYGVNGSAVDTIPFRSSADKMNAPPDLFTGDREVQGNGSWFKGPKISIVQDQPLPLTLLMIVPYLTVNK